MIPSSAAVTSLPMILIFSFSGLVASVVMLEFMLEFGFVIMLILLTTLKLFGIVIASGPVLAFVALPPKVLLLVPVRVLLLDNPGLGLLSPVPKQKNKRNLSKIVLSKQFGDCLIPLTDSWISRIIWITRG